MGFFDEVGKKISTAGQDAIAKTKDFADITKLNSNISDEQNRINSTYTQLGKLYYEIHKDDCEEALSLLVSSINDSMNKIKELQQQIIDIKGIVKCANCGAEVDKSAAFCASCGTAIPKEAVVEETQVLEDKTCPSCGTVIVGDSVFCGNCGTKL